jgi:hypothetical protein
MITGRDTAGQVQSKYATTFSNFSANSLSFLPAIPGHLPWKGGIIRER